MSGWQDLVPTGPVLASCCRDEKESEGGARVRASGGHDEGADYLDLQKLQQKEHILCKHGKVTDGTHCA